MSKREYIEISYKVYREAQEDEEEKKQRDVKPRDDELKNVKQRDVKLKQDQEEDNTKDITLLLKRSIYNHLLFLIVCLT